MKKIVSILLCILLIGAALCACGSQSEKKSDSKLSIVTTIFPLYDWAKNVAASTDADVRMLVDSGIDLHSFQPTVEDIGAISDCDVFIYVGGESDEWVDDALKQRANKDMIVIDLLDVLKDSIKEEEVVEGMEAEEEEEEGGEEEPEYDEHVWLSLKNAVTVCRFISDQLSKADPSNADTYQKNTETYTAELNALDNEYKDTVNNAENKILLFGDRFPFRYMVDDYGLSYYAAFVGCSAESEASFETIAFLSEKLNELGLKYILKLESSDGSVAEAIRNNSKDKDQEILTVDSLQSVTAEDVADGDTYLKIMRSNLDTLKKVLA